MYKPRKRGTITLKRARRGDYRRWLSLALGKLAKFLKPYTWQCIVGPLAKLAEAGLELYLPLLMARVIDEGVAKGDTGYILRMGGAMLGIVTVGLLCALVCQYVASVTSQGFGTELRNTLFRRISAFSHAELDRFGTPSLINRVTSDVNQLQYAVAMLIRLVIRAPFLCVGGIVMAMIIDLKLALVIILAIPLFVLVIVFIMRKTVPLHQKVQGRLDTLTRILRENLSGVRVIRAFARTGEEEARFGEATRSHTDAAVRVGKLSAVLNPLTQFIMNLAVLFIVWFGGVRVEAGGMTTGEDTAVEDPAAPAVEFRDVDFAYSTGESALENISFSVPRGATVGVIGGTGSGKSTLMALIVRFYDATKGTVLLGGVDVRAYSVAALRRKIGLVPQRVELFSGTIADNIRWGREDASEDEIRAAAAMAQAAEFIESRPEGYDAPVERGGANLSGGQRQRLTIARALVRRPEILILDDSTSALDYATDAALRRAVAGAEGMTVFLVSQRVSAVKNADRILVLDDGILAGAGTHDELLASCEPYREICHSQERGNGQ